MSVPAASAARGADDREGEWWRRGQRTESMALTRSTSEMVSTTTMPRTSISGGIVCSQCTRARLCIVQMSVNGTAVARGNIHPSATSCLRRVLVAIFAM